MKKREKKKQWWNHIEIEEDPEVKRLMPGIEVKWLITEDTVEGDSMASVNRCIFPPRSGHCKHLHKDGEEVCYIIKGCLSGGYTDENGENVETELKPGTAIFFKKGQVHWVNNSFDEQAEFISIYFGAPSFNKSGYVEIESGR